MLIGLRPDSLCMAIGRVGFLRSAPSVAIAQVAERKIVTLDVRIRFPLATHFKVEEGENDDVLF